MDSRGVPTIRTRLILEDGSIGIASVQSGASKGIFEAFELIDEDEDRYFGKGVKKAIRNIKEVILPALLNLNNPNL